MIFWLCSILSLGAAVVATFVADIRLAVVALWVVGMGAGGMFLSLGAELLAVVQWIVCTLVAMSFMFYAATFGEYGKGDGRPLKRRCLSAALPVLLGVAWAAVVCLGAHYLDRPSVAGPGPVAQDLPTIGKELVDHHFISLEVLSLTLFLVVVGAGVIARPEMKRQPEGDES